MPVETYTDFIVERLEIVSAVTIFASVFTYLNYGVLLALVPGAIFHLGAYFGYRRLMNRRAAECAARIASLKQNFYQGNHYE